MLSDQLNATLLTNHHDHHHITLLLHVWPSWALEENGLFSTKSLYRFLMNGWDSNRIVGILWKCKVSKQTPSCPNPKKKRMKWKLHLVWCSRIY